jgi:hypothetical protein
VRPVPLLGLGLSACLAVSAATAGQAADPPDAADDLFEKDVRPLLVEKCAKCHGDVRPKGGLKLTSRDHVLKGGDLGPAVVPGKPDASLLVKVVRYQDDLRMPPTGKLTDRQVEVLERWVRRGAPWPGAKAAPAPTDGRFAVTEKHRRFWSFRPVAAGPPPAVRDASWPRTPVDRFILAGLEASGITPAAPADKRTLLRRATFDLTGLPPTPAETDAFLTDDSPGAFVRVVDRLLASPRYGERWGRHWLDVVRYADARDLIQLPPESDFREAWRYRDWVVEAFDHDLPYTDFVRAQVAGDLLPAPNGFNKDGLVATGLLAIADFVPGDVDKHQMIADYVNDQVDVVGRAFLGLSVACARCHDHKFDPIPTEDYYALAGIFFSTRIIPGPVPGNTPLVRVPLLSPAETARRQEQTVAVARRRAELEQTVPDAADHAYHEYLTGLITGQAEGYLVAACECRRPTPGGMATSGDVARRHGLHAGVLAEWVAFLDRVAKDATGGYPPGLRDAAAGKLSGTELGRAAAALRASLAAEAKRVEAEAVRSPEKASLARASLLHFRADDPRLATDAAGRVTLWPNRSGFAGNAGPSGPRGPVKASAKIGDHTKSVVRFDGDAVLEAARAVPPAGSLFLVFQAAATARPGERVVGWEDSDTGRHGLGLMTDPGGRLHAVLRKDGQSGDLVDAKKAAGFETVCVTWGPGGTTLRRNGVATSAKTIDGLSSDPKIAVLRIGGPGSGRSPRFRGDIAEVRVYTRQLTEGEREQVETELRDAWFRPDDPKPPRDPVAELYAEVLSPRGPFWPAAAERDRRLSPDVRSRIAAQRAELDALRKYRPADLPQAIAAQDGGPKGTRHEGFKDAPVYIRGDHKRPGKTVPRGFPQVLTDGREAPIVAGSGRLQLADWLARPENPLPARVMVNRIWQHHFGQGLVRTPNDFGERGDRPTHPELLDYLAARFVASGWSVKAMHRLLMLSAVYQQGSQAGPTAARDPDNRLLGRMPRQRLEAEAVRDALLAAAGLLDNARGGPPFTDLAVPRRTLYLMAARTGANTSDFGRMFDRADPSLIVGQRGQSVVAPQALFFLNDPFVSATAKALAERVRREAPGDTEGRIRHLYALTLGRLPTKAEGAIGTELLTSVGGPEPLERYCLLILCTNEFLYID